MSKYAANTSVPVEVSEMEIKRTVSRYGAAGFMSGWHFDQATVQFIIGKDHDQRQIRFVMTLPNRADPKFTTYTRGYAKVHHRSPESAQKEWEQACRQKWRALALLVKAKLEAVDAGISTIEESFFADIVMPDGRTVYERAREAVALEYRTREHVPLLGGPAAW